jgi:hypothetical protein
MNMVVRTLDFLSIVPDLTICFFLTTIRSNATAPTVHCSSQSGFAVQIDADPSIHSTLLKTICFLSLLFCQISLLGPASKCSVFQQDENRSPSRFSASKIENMKFWLSSISRKASSVVQWLVLHGLRVVNALPN